MVDLQQIYESIEVAPLFNAENDVNFFLYTRANPNPTRITVGDAGLLFSTTFNAANPTRLLIHGWNGGADSSVLIGAAAAYRNQGEFNCIGVDWGAGMIL
jgi:pancreatic triacylglycerol lipase